MTTGTTTGTTWQQRAASGTHAIPGFRFANGETADLRLAYRTLGRLDADGGNAVLLLHGTVGSGLQFLRPDFADALFGPGEPLDAARYFIVLPDAIGHGGSSKPSDAPDARFPRYGYADIVAAQHAVVTAGLGLERLRLVMGTSMGGMQTWMWGIRYPDRVDALMPVASLPERITGRNLLLRRLLLAVARLDEPGRRGEPPAGLGLAWVLFQMMAASPARLAETLTSTEAADAHIRSVVTEALARENLPDVLAEFEASADYDPSADIHRIRAPLLALNFADDDINPTVLGGLEHAAARLPAAEFVTFAAGPETQGHQTQAKPALWKQHVRALLDRSEPHRAPGGSRRDP